MAMTAREIVTWAGMSEIPAVYANRVATWSDLSGSHLLGIYNKVKHEVGANAAEAFVIMVENLKILSVFNFLNALYALEDRSWVFAPFEETDLGVGSGDTEYIRNTFLARIGKVLPLNREHYRPIYRSF